MRIPVPPTDRPTAVGDRLDAGSAVECMAAADVDKENALNLG